MEVGRPELRETDHGRTHRGQVAADELPQIHDPAAGVPQPGQVRPYPHPTRILPLRRRLTVRVVLQRRQLPPGEVHILMHVRYVMGTDVRTQAFSRYFWTNPGRR